MIFAKATSIEVPGREWPEIEGNIISIAKRRSIGGVGGAGAERNGGGCWRPVAVPVHPRPSLASWGMKHESPGATTPVFRLSRADNPPHTSPSRIKRNEERTGIIIILVDRAQEKRKRKI